MSGVELLVSVVKGLVLRPILPCKHSLTQFGIDASTNSTNWQGVFLDLFLSLLFTNNNRSLAAACANQLTLLLQDPSPYEILSKTTSRGNYALFWQQKLFSLIFPSLQSQVRALMGKGATNGSNVTVSNPAAILLSVGKIIKGVSLALLKSNFDDFVESIIFVFSYVNVNESSNNDDFVIVDGEAISALQLLLKEKPVAFVDHLNIIIPRLIKVNVFSYWHSLVLLFESILDCATCSTGKDKSNCIGVLGRFPSTNCILKTSSSQKECNKWIDECIG